MKSRLVFAAWLLTVVGCPKQSPTPTDGTKQDSLRLIIVPESEAYNAWDDATVRVVLHNDGKSPLFILRARIQTGLEKAALDTHTTRNIEATAKGDEQHIEARYIVDYMMNPAVARAPMPPRWDIEGDRKLVTVAVLLPGERMDWQGRFRARYEAEPEFTARVDYVRPTQTMIVYEQGAVESKVLEEPERLENEASWALAETLRITYVRKGDGDYVDAMKPSTLSSHSGVELYRYGITDVALGAATVDAIETKIPLKVDRFDYDVGEARASCNVPHGPYTRLLGKDAWVVANDSETCFAVRAETTKVPGNWIKLADRLNDEGFVELTLFTNSDHPDPDGHLEYFKRNGFKATSKLQKGMSHRGEVTVQRDQLVEFAVAYTERGLPELE